VGAAYRDGCQTAILGRPRVWQQGRKPRPGRPQVRRRRRIPGRLRGQPSPFGGRRWRAARRRLPLPLVYGTVRAPSVARRHMLGVRRCRHQADTGREHQCPASTRAAPAQPSARSRAAAARTIAASGMRSAPPRPRRALVSAAPPLPSARREHSRSSPPPPSEAPGEEPRHGPPWGREIGPDACRPFITVRGRHRGPDGPVAEIRCRARCTHAEEAHRAGDGRRSGRSGRLCPGWMFPPPTLGDDRRRAVRPMPGDELVLCPAMSATHAITVDVPADGCGRGWPSSARR
jgi:hypothetical protein